MAATQLSKTASFATPTISHRTPHTPKKKKNDKEQTGAKGLLVTGVEPNNSENYKNWCFQ